MRTLIALLLMLVLVSGVAITGSRAQPLAGARSPAFSICQPNIQRVPDRSRCLPAIRVSNVGLDNDFGDHFDFGEDYGQTNEVGADFSDPDWPGRALMKILEVVWQQVVRELVERGMDRFFYESLIAPDGTTSDSTIFDPMEDITEP